jgi:hypothetical protein
MRVLFGLPVYEHQLVTGSSFVNVDEAAAEAQRKVVALAAAGWKGSVDRLRRARRRRRFRRRHHRRGDRGDRRQG